MPKAEHKAILQTELWDRSNLGPELLVAQSKEWHSNGKTESRIVVVLGQADSDLLPLLLCVLVRNCSECGLPSGSWVAPNRRIAFENSSKKEPTLDLVMTQLSN